MTPSVTAHHPVPARVRDRRRARTEVEPTAYDFRRPIQLSKEHSRILQVGLSEFARQASTVFTAALRTVCTVQAMSIAQESYAEYVDALSAPTYAVTFTADPVPGPCVLEIPLPAMMTSIDLMLGGHGTGPQPIRPLTDIESGVVGGLVERLVAETAQSLAAVVPITPVVQGVEYSPQFVQAAGGSDVMVVATLDLRIGERKYQMSMCFPFGALQPHLTKAAAPAAVSERERNQRARAADLMEDRFQDVPMPVTVRFRSTRVSPESIGGLAVGDVLRLTHPASTPLDVTVDDTTFAHATPGVRGARLAALVVGTPKENR